MLAGGKLCRDKPSCIVPEKEAFWMGACHDTVSCIMPGKGLNGQEVRSRYKMCIVTRRGKRQGSVCRDLGHDTAVPAPTHGHDTAARPTTRPAGGHDTAPGRACVLRLAKAVHLVHPASF